MVGVLFFLLAFQSFDTWREKQIALEQDRNADIKKRIKAAEIALHDGRKDEAKEALIDIRTRAKEGITSLLAAQYLAYIYYEEGKS